LLTTISKPLFIPLSKKGIVKPIKSELEKIYGKGEVAIIDGDIHSFKKKVELAKAFQEGSYRAIVCTGVIGEGIDLSCGDKRVDLVVSEPCITPREYYQLMGRPHRPGQREDVYVHVLASRSEQLEHMMRSEIAALEAEYGVKFRRNWQPTTIDVDRFNITEVKQRIWNEAVRRALPIPEELMEIMNEDDSPDTKKTSKVYKSTISEGEFKKLAKEKAENEYFGKNINRCIALKGQKYNPKKLQPLVEDYQNTEAWSVSTAAESNRVVVNLIKYLEEADGTNYAAIADLGSGPACLARLLTEDGLERKVDCVDGMKEMVNLGKALCKKEGVKKVKFYNRKLWDTKLKANAYDLVTCLNALHYNDQQGDRDIEKILIEANRITKQDGYLIVGLIPSTPHEVKPEIQNLSKAVERYGFEVKYDNMVSVEGVNENTKKKKKTKIPVIVAKKVREHTTSITGDVLPIYFPHQYVSTGGKKRVTLFDPKIERQRRKSRLIDKEYTSHKGLPLAQEVVSWH